MVSFSRLCGWQRRRSSKILVLAFFILVLLPVFYYMNIKNNKTFKYESIDKEFIAQKNDLSITKSIVFENHALKSKEILNTIARSTTMVTSEIEFIPAKLCNNVHAFYYPWYGNPAYDNEYLHWNHKYLPHWSQNIAKNYPSGAHIPPSDIGANFFPKLGPYSSRDPALIKSHMIQMNKAGIGVIAVSYYPPGMADDNGKDWQDIIQMLLEAGEKYNVKVTFQIEPYKDRSEATVKDDIVNIIDSYSIHPAFYKFEFMDKKLPLIYIYDSYHTKPTSWAKLLKDGNPDSIRGTDYDIFVIGLVVDAKDQNEMIEGGFNGFYTYFASDGFTYGSTRHYWKHLGEFARENDLLFIPSVGPGYTDTRVRPWNAENERHRAKGAYYSQSWKTALKEKPEIITITSFNEWHEGTQIEEVIPKKIENYKYNDYQPFSPDYYLTMTKNFITKFDKCKIYT